MTEFVNTIDLLGDETVARTVVDRTITEFNDDIVTTVPPYAFYKCHYLTSVNMPNLKSMGYTSEFYQCASLTSVNMPSLMSITQQAFGGCSLLASVNLPSVTSINGAAFYGCSSLASVNLPSLTSIGSNVFNGCSKLTTLILRSTKVCTLSNTSAFGYTPFASGGTGGTVYVPQALIESYQTATNWSTLYAAGTCNFVAIEDIEYDFYIRDGVGSTEWVHHIATAGDTWADYVEGNNTANLQIIDGTVHSSDGTKILFDTDGAPVPSSETINRGAYYSLVTGT